MAVWFKIALVASVLLLIYLLRSIYRDITAPEANAVKLPSDKERKSITLQELSKIWRLQCIEEEEIQKFRKFKKLEEKYKGKEKKKPQGGQMQTEEEEKKGHEDKEQQDEGKQEKKEQKGQLPEEQPEPEPVENDSRKEGLDEDKEKGGEDGDVENKEGEEEEEADEDEEVLKKLFDEGLPDAPPQLFKNPNIQEFYEKYVYPLTVLSDNERKVVMRLLHLLDEKGNVPSVVTEAVSKMETDMARDTTEYDILKHITLADHSIRVAINMIEEDDSLLTRAKKIITALAHDIGKIRDFYINKKYVFGSHAQTSVAVLKTMDGFRELEYAKEVEDAILKHHLSPLEGLGMQLKQADKKARQEEVFIVTSQSIKESLEGEKSEETNEKAGEEEMKGEAPASEQKQDKKNGGTKDAKKDTTMNFSEQRKVVNLDPYVRDGSDQKQQYKSIIEESKKIDLSWLPLDIFLSKLRDRINIETPGGGFDAFSDTRGYVYVQTGVVMDLFKEIAKENGKFDEYNFEDEKERRKILHALADLFRAHGYFADALTNRNYFAGVFEVRFYDGRSVRGKYMPFIYSAFVDDIAKLESKKVKGGVLSKIREVVRLSKRY